MGRPSGVGVEESKVLGGGERARAFDLGGRAGGIDWCLNKEWTQPSGFGKSLASGEWP